MVPVADIIEKVGHGSTVHAAVSKARCSVCRSKDIDFRIIYVCPSGAKHLAAAAAANEENLE